MWFDTIPSLLARSIRKKRLPENKSEWLVRETPLAESQELRITWIGHASFLIQVAGVNILTDPIFGDVSFFFPRILPPGISLGQLPAIDFVLLSHNHPDHCHMSSLLQLKQLFPQVTILAPLGDKKWLEKKGLATVEEHMWWQRYTHQKDDKGPVSFTFLPAAHWSARGIFDRNKSLWGSWMVHTEQSASKSIYFAGDTAYSPHFAHIAQEFSTIHTALMPIGPDEPNPCMRKSHLNADQAVQAFVDLNAAHFIPMHWGTFQFGRDHFLDPIKKLHHAWQSQLMSTPKKLIIPKVGQSLLL